MVIFAIILLSFAILLIAIMYAISKTSDSDDIMVAAGVGAVIMLFIVTGVSILKDAYYPPITPMDVYQNKTTLQITYKDSVIVDSVVVWK